MRVDDIKPYKDNARHNEKAIPKVAESIREFGFRGQIVLESRENPVIVAGHTRWAACKSLGWDEIPDEHIAFCDGLTKEQIDAFRLADNRTGEIATWNVALLKKEVKRLSKTGFDLKRFQFDFKSELKPYGETRQERLSVYNLEQVNRFTCERGELFPTVRQLRAVPPFSHCIGVNQVKTFTGDKKNTAVHFYVDDYQFERCWRDMVAWGNLLQDFKLVVAPDFSLYVDMPLPLQQYNVYRSRACAYYWQSQGVNMITNLQWADPDSYSFCFQGLQRKRAYALSTVGISYDNYAKDLFQRGVDEMVARLQPSSLLVYGGCAGFNFHGVDVVEVSNSTLERIRKVQ